MKTEKGNLNASPSKRIFKSIIADYDIKTSLCELVDNSLDQWIKKGKSRKLEIDIEIDINQRLIKISDNAGGIKESELSNIIGPGQTTSSNSHSIIGLFGVGSKRAVVAMAQDIKFKTRFSKNKSFQIDVDDNWLIDESWDLPYYEIDQIDEGTTIIELTRLRFPLSEELIERTFDHLEVTYGYYLKNKNLQIKINDKILSSKVFDNSWSYNPEYLPKQIKTSLTIENSKIECYITAGLTREGGSAGQGDYGVFFYCNDRLISRAEKSFEVGFTSGKAGQPHGTISLTRVIIKLFGSPQYMPWNSSKSGIDYKSIVFESVRDTLIDIVTTYASLCRRLYNDAEEKIYAYDKGTIERKTIQDFPNVKKAYTLALPPVKIREEDLIKFKNQDTGKAKPWTVGLYETIIAVTNISKNKKLSQKNRINLLLLDSSLEIGFKEFLLHDSGQQYSEDRIKNMFQDRIQVHNEIKKVTKDTKREISEENWKKIKFFYDKRCDLIHKKATNSPTDDELNNFKELTEKVFKKLFNLSF
jgi:hypothetical protein